MHRILPSFYSFHTMFSAYKTLKCSPSCTQHTTIESSTILIVNIINLISNPNIMNRTMSK